MLAVPAFVASGGGSGLNSSRSSSYDSGVVDAPAVADFIVAIAC